MEIDIDQLPQTAAEIVDAVGVDAALRLVEVWGGVRVYVPQRITDDHALVSTLGRGLAETLAARFGGEALNIPRCLHALRAVRNTRIRSERRQGDSPASLALRYGLTERQVYSILAADDAPDDRQSSLL